ncbi:hypothetical protein SDC9_105389 [bioreactor metagenome]|uniref:Uncharacterized protein n=1 Tax=bioreactor metagenome TaxID=1076179 RepID=A0A645B0I6_9ZZZZ
MREHIHRLYSPNLVVAESQEVAKVPVERPGVAGDVDDALGSELDSRCQKALVTAAARGIEEQYITNALGFCHLLQLHRGIGTDELCIGQVVPLGIQLGILDSLFIRFNTKNIPCTLLGGYQGNRSGPAVGIDNHVFLTNPGHTHGQRIQHLGLLDIDLEEGGRRDAEGEGAEFLLNIAFAPEYLDGDFAEHHAGVLAVHVQCDGGDLGMLLLQGSDEVVR